MPSANVVQTSVSGGQQNALALQGDGVFLPKLSTATRTALTLGTSDKGFLAYDTTDNNVYIWNGAAWESVPASGDSSNTQVIFNDNGTLAGDAGLTYDKATDSLTVLGNLGVGVSPSYKIHSAVTSGFAGAFRSSTAVAGGILCGNSLADLIVGVDASGNGRLTADTSKYLGLGSNGINDRVILDSIGNVGIGVTPIAWRSTNKAVQVGSYSSLTSSSAGDLQLFNNAYINSGGANIYQSNGFATRYEQYQGVHAWYTAPSGTAGNAVTFVQAMTLDASGRLIINSSTFLTPTLNTNGELNFMATSNTNVRFSYRGTDGVTRVANITLV